MLCLLSFCVRLTSEVYSRFPTCTDPPPVPLTQLLYWKTHKHMTTQITITQQQQQHDVCVFIHTCTRDISMFLSQSSAPNMTPDQNTVKHYIHIHTHVYIKYTVYLYWCVFTFISCSSPSAQCSENSHLNVFAVVTSRRQQNTLECDWTFQRHFDGCLLHPVLTGPTHWHTHTTEVSLHCREKEIYFTISFIFKIIILI